MANPYLDYLASYGGSLGTAGRHLGTAGRIAGRAVPIVAPVAMGALDYFDGKAQGENDARAFTSAVGSGLGGWGGAAAGAAAGAAVGSVVPVVGTAIGGVVGGIGGALLGSKAGNAAVDAGWQAFTDDDGLQAGSNARKKHFAGLFQQAKADYNADPTPEKKRKAEAYYAEATGTTVSGLDNLDPTSSESAFKLVNDYFDPDKNPLIRKGILMSRQDDNWQDQRKLRDAAFKGRYDIGAANLSSYWDRLKNSANDAATIAGAGASLVGGGRF